MRFPKIPRRWFYYLLAAMVLLALYFLFQVLDGWEEFAAGRSSTFDLHAILFQEAHTHLISGLLRIAVLLIALLATRGAFASARKSQERLERILETAADGIYFVNRSGRMTMVNAAVEKMLGATRAEICKTKYNHPTWKTTTPDGKPFPDEEQPFSRVIKTGAPVHGVEQYLQRADGKQILVSINATPLKREFGQVIGVVGTLTDITERKRAEKELETTTSLLKSLFDNLDEFFFSVDVATGRVLQASNACEKMFGVSAQSFMDDPNSWRRFIHLDDKSKVADARSEMSQGTTTIQEMRIVDSGGQPRWVEAKFKPIMDSSHRPVRFDAILSDITERKRGERALIESEERYKNIVENANDIIYRTDANGRFVFYNAKASQLLKYSADELIGRHYLDIIDPDFRKETRQFYRDQIVRQIPNTYHEVVVIGKDGTKLWLGQNVQLLTEEGRLIGFQSVARDISERKRAESEAQRHVEQLSTLNEIGRTVSTARDLTSVLDTIYEQVSRIIPFDAFYISLYAVETDELSFPLLIDGGKRYLSERKKPIHGSDLFMTLTTGIPRRIIRTPEDMVQPPKPGTGVGDQSRQSAALLFAPLFVKDNVIGVISAQSYTANAYSEEHLQLLTSIAYQAAIAINNARLLEALYQSEDRYKELYDKAPIAYYSVDASDGRIRMANQTMAEMLGYAMDDLIARPIFDVYADTPFGKEKAKQVFERFRAGEEIHDEEVQMLTAEGKPLWVSISAQAVRDAAGSVVYSRSMAQDISKRKAAEEGLRQAEEKYRGIFENAIVGIYQTSMEGKWLTANSALARTLGYESPAQMIDEMSDLNRQFYVDPNRRADFVREMEEHDVVWGFESEVRRRDGSIIWFSENARTIRDQADNRIGFEGTTIDITDRKQVDRLKSEFVSVVSHELRTPLTSIRGSLGLIAGGVAGEIAPKAKSLVDIAYKNSERLILLINDILDIEKIESGKMVFDNRPMELLPLLEQAVEANTGYAEQYGVKLLLNSQLPSVMVNADYGRLTQVVTNLISNAVKFSPRGGVVEIALAQRKANVRVSIQDHGSGIPEEFQSRIFQKFAQADSSTTRQRGGTGLGLNICKAIIEKLSGRIGFESQPNVGTTFFFDLPEWRDESAAPTAPAKTRILVCEDDYDTAALLQLLLQQAGFAIDLAHTAAQAKMLLQKNHYGALTLDLALPDQDDIAFIHDLRENESTRALPVIVVSVRAEQGRVAVNGDAVKVIDWISKPIDAKRLIGAVNCATAHAPKPAVILHIEDDDDVFQVAALMLQDIARVEHATTLKQARERLSHEHFDLVILDLEMPDGSGLELVPLLQAQIPPIPIVVFSVDEISKETAAKVSAVLIKSRTSNEKLVETIRSLVPTPQPVIAGGE